MDLAVVVSEAGTDAAAGIALARKVASRVEHLVIATPGGERGASPEADARFAVELGEAPAPEDLATAVSAFADSHGAQLVLLAAQPVFREALGLVAVSLGAAAVTDATDLAAGPGGLVATRMLYGGSAMAEVAVQRPRAVVSHAFGGVPAASSAESEPVEVVAPAGVRKVLSRRRLPSEASLKGARRIVSFGRGVRSKEDMAMITSLAQALGAELGCSRPIVEDMRWLGSDHQVGLTGTTVAPDLYLAVGISGQIQHLVGMRDSKVIVAVNNNPAAPIFEVADIGVVGDLYQVVPSLLQALSAAAG